MATTVPKIPNWRYLRNLFLAAIAMLFVAFYLIIPAYMANRAIHPERFPIGSLTPMDVALDYEEVTLTTIDGIRLSGWYIPAKNGAAVIAVHAYNGNRTGVIYHAKMLADHGYGVLLFDLRAHGESGGDVFAFGWDADKDISAALTYLQNRADVEPNRIGVLGLSIGAEVVLQAAANTDKIKAVVAEGSGYRMVEEWLLAPEAPGKILAPGQWIFFKTGEILSGVPQAAPLPELIAEIAPTPLLLISAGADNQINQIYYESAREPKTLWARAESGHIDGLFSHPEEYEERVTTFFDGALFAEK